ncbi:MAG: DUF4350 domain-containing protein [Chloroflexota bacterium]
MGLHRYLVLLTIALSLLLVLIIWFFPSYEDFRAENRFWNGTGALVSGHNVAPLESLADLPPSPGGATLIVIPYLDFARSELEALDGFVRQGGTLLLADDFGYGNRVLEYLGLPERFNGQALLDPVVNYRNEWLPGIIHLRDSPLTANADSLVFNHATALLHVADGDIVALSSSFSFLDQNGNQTRDAAEPSGPLPVISRHGLGSGQVILIADPSLFINSMETMAGNSSLVGNIATAATAGLFIDQSHLPPSDLHRAKGLLAQIRASIATPAGGLWLALAALALTLAPVWRRKRGELEKTANIITSRPL